MRDQDGYATYSKGLTIKATKKAVTPHLTIKERGYDGKTIYAILKYCSSISKGNKKFLMNNAPERSSSLKSHK